MTLKERLLAYIKSQLIVTFSGDIDKRIIEALVTQYLDKAEVVDKIMGYPVVKSILEGVQNRTGSTDTIEEAAFKDALKTFTSPSDFNDMLNVFGTGFMQTYGAYTSTFIPMVDGVVDEIQASVVENVSDPLDLASTIQPTGVLRWGLVSNLEWVNGTLVPFIDEDLPRLSKNGLVATPAATIKTLLMQKVGEWLSELAKTPNTLTSPDARHFVVSTFSDHGASIGSLIEHTANSGTSQEMTAISSLFDVFLDPNLNLLPNRLETLTAVYQELELMDRKLLEVEALAPEDRAFLSAFSKAYDKIIMTALVLAHRLHSINMKSTAVLFTYSDTGSITPYLNPTALALNGTPLGESMDANTEHFEKAQLIAKFMKAQMVLGGEPAEVQNKFKVETSAQGIRMITSLKSLTVDAFFTEGLGDELDAYVSDVLKHYGEKAVGAAAFQMLKSGQEAINKLSDQFPAIATTEGQNVIHNSLRAKSATDVRETVIKLLFALMDMNGEQKRTLVYKTIHASIRDNFQSELTEDWKAIAIEVSQGDGGEDMSTDYPTFRRQYVRGIALFECLVAYFTTHVPEVQQAA